MTRAFCWKTKSCMLLNPTDGNRKWSVFPFNLFSHCHIYISKNLFTSGDDCFKIQQETTALACLMISSSCCPWLKNVSCSLLSVTDERWPEMALFCKLMLNVWNLVKVSCLQSWKVWSLIDENEEKPLYMYDFSISKVMAFVSSVTGQVPRKSCRPKLCCAKPVMSPKIHSLVARNPESYSPIFYRVYKLEKSNILCKSQGINS